jgi:excisionase family DNA binding protein
VLDGFEARWQREVAEILARVKEWRLQHPKATFLEIEAALDARWPAGGTVLDEIATDNEWMTVPEAARWIGVGENELYRAAESGEVPCMKVGRRVLMSRTSLRQFPLERWGAGPRSPSRFPSASTGRRRTNRAGRERIPVT